MPRLYELHDRPDFVAPPLVLHLEGWIDAGGGGATAMQTLVQACKPRTIATFDADVLLDHRARRPTLHLRDGVNTGLTWPSILLRAGVDEAGNDVLLLTGPEPDNQWQAFVTELVELIASFQTRMVIGLGAYPAAVPHTRPPRLSCTATDPAMAARVGYVAGALDIPAGVQAAIERMCAGRGIQAVGLWAQVPHYVSASPYPAASLTLLAALRELTGVTASIAGLQDAAQQHVVRLNELVAQNPEHVAMVRQLEEAIDEANAATNLGESTRTEAPLGEVPSADELAAEVERFLREHGDDQT